MNTAMTQQARIRRLQDTLIIAGDGVIAFSAWSLAKTALFLIFVDETKVRLSFNLDDSLPMMLLYIAVALVLLVDLAVRSYIGLSARKRLS